MARTWEGLAVGGVTTVVAKTVPAPIERVKLMLQTQPEMIKQNKLSTPYRGLFDCLKRTYQVEGFRSLWRGNLAACMHMYPSQILSFTIKEKIKATIKENPNHKYRSHLIVSGGALAGMLPLCLFYPLDFARTKLAADAKLSASGGREYSGINDVFRRTIHQDGVRGVYRGFVVGCVYAACYRGLVFGIYDKLKPYMHGGFGSVVLLYGCGYVVTVTAGLLSYPLDTVRQRLVLTAGQPVKYKGSYDCCIHILKTDGLRWLWKGAGANIIRGISSAAVLVGFDMVGFGRVKKQQVND